VINWLRNLSTGAKAAIIAGIILLLLSCCCVSSAVLVYVVTKPDVDVLEDLESEEEESLEKEESEKESEEPNESDDEEEDRDVKKPSEKKPVEKKVIYLSWKFENSEGPAPEYAQRTRIDLVISGDIDREVYIGTYNGTAWDMKKSGNWTPPADALMACASFWAGEGNEIAVFKTSPDELTIRHRLSYEEETEPGPFEDLKTVDISVSTSSGPVNPEVEIE